MAYTTEKTRTGKPAVWEEGGGRTNTGFSVIVCDRHGEPVSPLYVRRRGHLANSKHALLPVYVGDTVIVTVSHHRNDFEITIEQVVSVFEEGNGYRFDTEPVAIYEKGEWLVHNGKVFSYMYFPILAGISKARCYHCREPHYVKRYINIGKIPKEIIGEIFEHDDFWALSAAFSNTTGWGTVEEIIRRKEVLEALSFAEQYGIKGDMVSTLQTIYDLQNKNIKVKYNYRNEGPLYETSWSCPVCQKWLGGRCDVDEGWSELLTLAWHIQKSADCKKKLLG